MIYGWRYDRRHQKVRCFIEREAFKKGFGTTFHGYNFCSWVVGSCVESQPMMTPDNAEAIIVFLFYCLAVHVTQQERRKRG